MPIYQREVHWNEKQQSEFIESVLLGFPISSLLFAKNYNLERLEILDGGQRIRTLARFLNNELKLQKLNKLEKLNGFTFSDLPLARQKRFRRSTLRAIILTGNTDDEVIHYLFERLNIGGIGDI